MTVNNLAMLWHDMELNPHCLPYDQQGRTLDEQQTQSPRSYTRPQPHYTKKQFSLQTTDASLMKTPPFPFDSKPFDKNPHLSLKVGTTALCKGTKVLLTLSGYRAWTCLSCRNVPQDRPWHPVLEFTLMFPEHDLHQLSLYLLQPLAQVFFM
jgi:hypothetical protein